MFNFLKRKTKGVVDCTPQKEKEKEKKEKKEKKEDTKVVFERLRDNPDKEFIANLKVGDYVCLIDEEGGTVRATVTKKAERIVVEFIADLGFTCSKPLHYTFSPEGIVVNTDQHLFTTAIVIAEPKYWKN